MKLSISILFYTIYKAVIIVCLMFQRRLPTTLVIITYHSIKSEKAAKFEKQMVKLLKLGQPVSAESNLTKVAGGNYIAVTFDDGFQNVLQNALPVLVAKSIPATFFIATGYLGKKPGWIFDPKNPNADEVLLTEEQLIGLPDNLITIGSHTVTHLHLDDVDEDVVVKEIFDSKKRLEEILHRQITSISVPYGTFNQKFTGSFKKVGYQHIFLDVPTFPSTNTNLYIMGRISVDPSDWPIEFHLKLLGAYQWLPFAIKMKTIL